jgi:hypothetical protein
VIDSIRRSPRLLGCILAGCLLNTRALGGTLLAFDETTPLFAVNNMATPQVKLAGAIMLLFAGSLSLLAVGYVVDSVRSEDAPFR